MNRNTFEARLNEQFADAYSEEEAVDNFIYMTTKSRGKHTTEQNIRTHHNNHQLGTLLRKYDPIAFTVQYNDANRK